MKTSIGTVVEMKNGDNTISDKRILSEDISEKTLFPKTEDIVKLRTGTNCI